MKRHRWEPRPGWQDFADSIGFTWAAEDGLPYWDESIAYSFSLKEVEQGIEIPAADLNAMCFDLVDKVIASDELMARLHIPEAVWDYVAASWHRDEPTLYGRFDFAFDGSSPAKLYEYNADTPTSAYETAVFQWLWLEDQIGRGALPPEADQFNSLYEKLVERFGAILPKGSVLHLASEPDFVEDRQTVRFLEDTANHAGLRPVFLPIQNIGLNENGEFVDESGLPITALFKLYPWEDMFQDDYAAHLTATKTRMIEPAWKAILSNKGILPLLWQQHPGHPNLLETYFEDDANRSALGASYVRKPFFSREGANITLVDNGHALTGIDGGYGRGPHILQALHAPPRFDDAHVIIGCWIVGDEPAGMALREDASRITCNTSRFVPHYIQD